MGKRRGGKGVRPGGGKKNSKKRGLVAAAKAIKLEHRLVNKTKQREEALKKSKQKKKEKARLNKAYSPYNRDQKILLIGEGNLSFAASLAAQFGNGDNITATIYDSLETFQKKYEDGDGFRSKFTELGGQFLDEVDAEHLNKSAPQFRYPIYDRIVFHFPHTGSGIKDTTKNILDNQRMIFNFLMCSSSLLDVGGEIHITLKKGAPYDDWKIAKLATLPLHEWNVPLYNQLSATSTTTAQLKNSDFTPKLALLRALDFWPHLYPGYEHRRTIGFHEDKSQGDNADIRKGARTYVFVPAHAVEQKEPNAKKKGKTSTKAKSKPSTAIKRH